MSSVIPRACALAPTYRMESGFRLRAYWYRTLTTNGRDTDVVMLGLGRAL